MEGFLAMQSGVAALAPVRKAQWPSRPAVLQGEAWSVAGQKQKWFPWFPFWNVPRNGS